VAFSGLYSKLFCYFISQIYTPLLIWLPLTIFAKNLHFPYPPPATTTIKPCSHWIRHQSKWPYMYMCHFLPLKRHNVEFEKFKLNARRIIAWRRKSGFTGTFSWCNDDLSILADLVIDKPLILYVFATQWRIVCEHSTLVERIRHHKNCVKTHPVWTRLYTPSFIRYYVVTRSEYL